MNFPLANTEFVVLTSTVTATLKFHVIYDMIKTRKKHLYIHSEWYQSCKSHESTVCIYENNILFIESGKKLREVSGQACFTVKSMCVGVGMWQISLYNE